MYFLVPIYQDGSNTWSTEFYSQLHFLTLFQFSQNSGLDVVRPCGSHGSAHSFGHFYLAKWNQLFREQAQVWWLRKGLQIGQELTG